MASKTHMNSDVFNNVDLSSSADASSKARACDPNNRTLVPHAGRDRRAGMISNGRSGVEE